MGVGVDIENIDRFIQFKVNKENSFLKNIFTDRELDYCFSKKISANHLAVRYAGKEATIKAFHAIGRNINNYKDIEIISDNNGVPRININNIKTDNLETSLSLSHCKDKAIAFVIITERNENEGNQKNNPN